MFRDGNDRRHVARRVTFLRSLLMMKLTTTFALVLCGILTAAGLRAAEVRSGPQPGETLGAFEVTKVAGAPDDGVKVGQDLCYRCKMGNRPMVMVFSRRADRLGRFVKKLDGVVAKNKDEYNMGSFVTVLGDKPDELAKESKDIVTDTKVKNVAFVVSKESNGPDNYKLNPAAETTVLIYVKGKVVANHSLPPGGLTDEAEEQILKDTSKILK
jgi:hypothetical protein